MVKQSHATEATLEIVGYDDHIYLLLQDNAVGFDTGVRNTIACHGSLVKYLLLLQEAWQEVYCMIGLHVNLDKLFAR